MLRFMEYINLVPRCTLMEGSIIIFGVFVWDEDSRDINLKIFYYSYKTIYKKNNLLLIIILIVHLNFK